MTTEAPTERRERRPIVCYTVPASLVQWVNEESLKKDLSRSEIVTRALRSYRALALSNDDLLAGAGL